MERDRTDELPTVDDWGDVPAFASEREEAEFWATHGLGGRALESLGTLDDAELPRPRQRKRRFWQRITEPPEMIINRTKKPVVVHQYVSLGRAYREYAA